MTPRRLSSPLLAALALALVAVPVVGGTKLPSQEPATATTPVEPGAQLQSLDDERRAVDAPFGVDFLRITTKECRRCLKTCLGGKIQAAQVSFMRVQAPLSLVTWYLFRNRPFSMMPLEKAIAQFFGLPPVLFAGVAAGAYMSCRDLCDLDCPYPGTAARPDDLPELDEVQPTDTSFLSRLYQRSSGGGGGGGGGGGFASALQQMFSV